MVPAVNFEEIVKLVNSQFQTTPIRMSFCDSVNPVARDAMEKMNQKIKKHSIVAVLFCNPNTRFCKSEVLNNLNYLHHRSGKYIDFFCCGYGAYWPENHYADQRVVTHVNGEQWNYSDIALISVLEEFENNTKWKYSGENELLILDVSPSQDQNLNINNTIVCNLESMSRDKAFTSARAFFEDLIRYSSSEENVSAWSYSDKQGGKIAKEFLKNAILGLLPKSLQDSYKKAESYVIKQI